MMAHFLQAGTTQFCCSLGLFIVAPRAKSPAAAAASETGICAGARTQSGARAQSGGARRSAAEAPAAAACAQMAARAALRPPSACGVGGSPPSAGAPSPWAPDAWRQDRLPIQCWNCMNCEVKAESPHWLMQVVGCWHRSAVIRESYARLLILSVGSRIKRVCQPARKTYPSEANPAACNPQD